MDCYLIVSTIFGFHPHGVGYGFLERHLKIFDKWDNPYLASDTFRGSLAFLVNQGFVEISDDKGRDRRYHLTQKGLESSGFQ